jgi:cytochrome c oxidase accessory protein FixG
MSSRTVHLPVIQSSLRNDGSRNWVYPADVRGKWLRARRVVFAVLVCLWAVLPFLSWHGRPVMQLNVEQRRFFILGATFGAQDAWLLIFVLGGVGLALVIVTALWGRLWCGWACPQTVFLEGFFRPIERLIEGNREARIKLDKGPWTRSKWVKKTVKHTLFVLTAAFVAHVFVGYFVSPLKLWAMIGEGPAKHPEAFAWAAGLTAIFYGNFARFREQTCVGICPYGRLQSVLVDNNTTVVGYDVIRGEPRGKLSTTKGDCVDCKRCVVVCPMGIDVRNGLQPDCISCAQCVDACDEIMDKLERPRGLIRHEATNVLQGGTRKVMRARMYLYGAVALLWGVGAIFAFRTHTAFEAGLARVGATPFVIDGDVVRNAFTVHVVSKSNETTSLTIAARGDATFAIPVRSVQLQPFGAATLPIVVTVPRARLTTPITIEVRAQDGSVKTMQATALGPGGGS